VCILLVAASILAIKPTSFVSCTLARKHVVGQATLAHVGLIAMASRQDRPLHRRHGPGVDMLLTNSVAVGGDQAETATRRHRRWPALTTVRWIETCTSSWASRCPPWRWQGGISDRSLSAPWNFLKLEGFLKRNRCHLYSLEWFGSIFHSYDKLVYQFNTVYKFVYEFAHHAQVCEGSAGLLAPHRRWRRLRRRSWSM
jgi:hypothetical protein